ncbi:rubrerythrin [Waterburya agarophytonicola K14]|uniref:Rubrerythrin n=1 Tax=Waterburya agarophytonicola KI4 TaxID=2874699 RepID=A0A964BLC2_9CYAN|nr:rubrerythrin family protein [Waterburya agarophytonicola]MCC0175500.1 rubrerythrin [Waterburya agarophytonicola KI4]
MTEDSRSDSIIEKTGIWTVITSLIVLFLVYFSRSRPPEVKVEESLKGKVSPTLDNLQKAYDSEANSHVLYLNFAEKAREEGYKDVALLFQTLADAEKIHRDNHKRVIEAMGATPEKIMIVPQVASNIDGEVDSTTNNLSKLIRRDLRSSVNGESAEQQMYAQFIKQAKLDNNSAALKTFKTALVAEHKHSQILDRVKGNLNDWKLADHQLYVCQLTGETFDSHPGLEACSPK